MKKPIKFIVSSFLFFIPCIAFANDSFLPFLKADAEAMGYELPETYGLSISHMGMKQGINVQQIGFSNLYLFNRPISPNLIDIKIGKTRQKSNTETLRFDAWILPFMNTYAILAHTKGRSVSEISSVRMGGLSLFKDLKFRLDFEGTTYGAGVTFAGAYDDFFGTLDLNYTQTKFDVLDGQINTFTASPRIGYRFTTPAIKNFNIGTGKMNLWIGSMYQNVDQTFKGSLSDLSMPKELQGMISLVNKRDEGRFLVKQHLTNPWNVLIGGSYEVTQNFNITVESGFAKRNQFFASLQYRF